MKLPHSQLQAKLSQKLAAVYLISGEEPFLKQETIQQIRKAAEKAGITERVRLMPETEGDWEQLYSLLYSTSLLAEKRMLELDLCRSLPSKAAGQVLKEYGERPLPDNLLLITMGKLDNKIAKTAWYASLEKAGIGVTVWPLFQEQLPQWLMQRLKKYKLQMDAQALALFADQVEGNLTAAAQVIEKLYLLKPEGPIDRDLLATVLVDEGRCTMFDFVDNLIAGNTLKACHLLEKLKVEGAEPALILWGALREFRLLAEMAYGLQQGLSHEQVFQQQHIFPRRQPSIRRFLALHSASDCRRHLKFAAEIDKTIKGAWASGDVWESLQRFCLRVSFKECSA